MDEYCGNCGALLSPDADWCTLCLTPIARPGAEPAAEGAPVAAAATRTPPPTPTKGTASAALPAAPPERQYADPRTGKVTDPGENKYYDTPEFSRWRQGPDSFGPIGRGILTAVVILVLVGGFTLVHAAIFAFTGFLVPANGLRVLYGIPAFLLGLYLVSKIWKRSRYR